MEKFKDMAWRDCVRESDVPKFQRFVMTEPAPESFSHYICFESKADGTFIDHSSHAPGINTEEGYWFYDEVGDNSWHWLERTEEAFVVVPDWFKSYPREKLWFEDS